jgi:hypothetical protein
MTAEKIIHQYELVSKFLEAETVFRARPLKITVDGPYSVGGSFEVSLSGKGITRQDADKPGTVIDPLNDAELADHAGLPGRIMGMTIRELLKRYGGIEGVERYFRIVRDLVEAEKNDLVARELRLGLEGWRPPVDKHGGGESAASNGEVS